MFESGIILIAASACCCLLGGVLGNTLLARRESSAKPENPVITRGFWKRALALGLLVGAALAWNGNDPLHRLAVIVWLGVGFISAASYVVAWRMLITTYGPAAIEAGELSLAATLMLTVLMYVSGVLWIALWVLGGCTLLAMTVANGVWLYRLR